MILLPQDFCLVFVRYNHLLNCFSFLNCSSISKSVLRKRPNSFLRENKKNSTLCTYWSKQSSGTTFALSAFLQGKRFDVLSPKCFASAEKIQCSGVWLPSKAFASLKITTRQFPICGKKTWNWEGKLQMGWFVDQSCASSVPPTMLFFTSSQHSWHSAKKSFSKSKISIQGRFLKIFCLDVSTQVQHTDEKLLKRFDRRDVLPKFSETSFLCF